MRLHCPVTGIETNAGHFIPNSKLHVISIHPVIALPLSQINKINHNENKSGKVTEFDTKLLFCAYLYKTRLVQYQQPIHPNSLPFPLVTRYYELVLKLANAKVNTNSLPKFSTGLQSEREAVEQLRHYLNMIQLTVDSGHSSPTVQDSNSKTDAAYLIEELEDRNKYRQQIAAARKRRSRSVRENKRLALSTLEAQIPASKYIIIESLFNDSSRFPLNAIKKVKHLCLDHLPEGSIYEATRKDEVTQWLDTLIVNRLQMSLALANNNEQVEDINKELSELSSRYTVIHAEQERLNSAVPVAKQINDMLDSTEDRPQMHKPEYAPIPTPTTAPKPEDYPNRMAFMIAQKRFNESMKAL